MQLRERLRRRKWKRIKRSTNADIREYLDKSILQPLVGEVGRAKNLLTRGRCRDDQPSSEQSSQRLMAWDAPISATARRRVSVVRGLQIMP